MATDPLKVKCITCMFYDARPVNQIPGSSDTRGLCRRYAPMVYTGSTTRNPGFLWPSVKETDSCGEWELRPPEGAVPVRPVQVAPQERIAKRP